MTAKTSPNVILFFINSDFETDLNNGDIKKINKIFYKNHVSLSADSIIKVDANGKNWSLIDKEKHKVYALKKDAKDADKIAVVENIHVVNQIVDAGLCVRCGACDPACPVDIIKFDSQAYPYITNEEECITTCIRCLKVCPGKIVDFNMWDDEMFGARPHPESITGIVRRSMIGYSTDNKIRQNGASGGLVTQLLIYLLDKGIINGALVLGSKPDDNGYNFKSYVARTPDEIKSASRSKYILIEHLEQLREIENVDGKYAVVALPCHIHAIKKYQKVSKKLRERIVFIIGLYCNVAFEPYLLDDLVKFSGYKREEIINIEFRAGEWPGGVEFTLRDGTIKKPLKFEEMKDTFNSFKLFYTASRCNLCIDFSAEYGDISVGDPWLRGEDGNYLFEDSRTTILTRTEFGDKLIDMAAAEGYISVQDLPLKTYMMNFERNAKYKRDFVPKTMELRKLFNLSAPEYTRPTGFGKLTSLGPMLLKTITLYFSKYKWFRRAGLSILQTRIALKLFEKNRRRKKNDFASHYSEMEKFVERVKTDPIYLNGDKLNGDK